MNKLLCLIKYLLFLVSALLIIYFIKEYHLFRKEEITKFNFTFIVTISLFIIIFILNIIDLIRIKKINKLNGYNILSIVDLMTIIFIFGRTLFDKSIVSNQLKDIFYGYYDIYGFKYCMFYCTIINILLILNIIFIIINIKKTKRKKH